MSLFLRKLRIALLAGFGMLAAIAIGITVWTVYADRDARLSADTEQSAMLARALEEHGRIVAYRAITELGLVVTIGHDVEATLAAWRREAVARFAILAGGLALSAILLVFTLGQLRRREAGERLMRESEERFRKAFDAGPAAMSLISHPDGRYVDVNNAWLATYGYDRAEVIGRSSIEFGLWIDPAERARLYEDLEDMGSLPGLSTRHRCKSGDIAEVVTSCELIEIGGRRCLLAFNYDTTSQKRAEDALKRLNLELENRVQERTAKLEAANEELETFTYSVSHDLKAPLRSIDGYSRLLLEGYADRLDDEGRQFLHNVHQATLQMAQLIEDMLAYSRLERRDMQPGPVDARSLIEALLAERAEEVQARGIAVTLALGCTVVTADRDGLTMAIRNLLENALKFTRDAPHPEIEVGGRDAGDSCILWVRDNGVGFDMKYHERIFAIFQRLHRSEDYPGTGVGLAIVRKAMQRMGGRAWAESEPGKGATFYLEIPK